MSRKSHSKPHMPLEHAVGLASVVVKIPTATKNSIACTLEKRQLEELLTEIDTYLQKPTSEVGRLIVEAYRPLVQSSLAAKNAVTTTEES